MEGALRRGRGYPANDATVPDYRGHSTTLREILEGLEAGDVKIFPTSDVEDDGVTPGRIVLKVSGKGGPVEAIFNGVKMVPLAQNHDRSLYCLSDEESRAAFAAIVERYADDPADFMSNHEAHREAKSWKQALAHIKGIEVYDRADRSAGLNATAEEPGFFRVFLWPTSMAGRRAEKFAKARLDEIQSLIDSNNILNIDARPDYLSITARLSNEELDSVLDNPLVERVRTLPSESNDSMPVQINSMAVPQSLKASGPAIGVVDDLVTGVNPWIGVAIHDAPISPPNSASNALSTDHGNVVAGLAAYGEIDVTTLGGYSPFPVVPARVLSADGTGRPTLFDESLVATQVRWLAAQGVKVVCIAMTRGHADDGAVPDTLSATLDTLACELDIVIVVPSGNLDPRTPNDWLNGYPNYVKSDGARVAAPGTAVSCVTVGAVAGGSDVDPRRNPSLVRIARPGEAAPYGRTAPGRSISISTMPNIKPEFARAVGNWGYDVHSDTVRPDVDALGVPVLVGSPRGRHFGVAVGTSYGAALVAHEAAAIRERYPDASASLTRCLLALSAKPLQDSQSLAGRWGVPNYRGILESDSNRVIVTFESEISSGNVAFLEVPIPGDFARVRGRRRFRVALAFAPPVLRSRSEYMAGHIEFDLTHDYSLEQLREIYREQPSLAELEANPELTKSALPDRRASEPNKTSLNSSTLHLREYSSGWDVDNSMYTLIIRHFHSPWTKSQLKNYPTQKFSVAIEMLHEGEIDLYSETVSTVQNHIRTRTRVRSL
ncbi:hypothetical protein FM114_06365 [Luteococcus japonicus LSP_Lj1]|uniref:Peptidase S8/S53 domain-containing protein n=2 Tax=Luteococcus japonicus TaxID=33984 RepID=A0A1R4J9L9_9ACTN|nr:hypothetical protein FM114_06365 [Luteococcus japonicus LSP_Lj1]